MLNITKMLILVKVSHNSPGEIQWYMVYSWEAQEMLISSNNCSCSCEMTSQIHAKDHHSDKIG